MRKCVDCGAPTSVPIHYQHVPTVCDGCMAVRRAKLKAYRAAFNEWAHGSMAMRQPELGTYV